MLKRYLAGGVLACVTGAAGAQTLPSTSEPGRVGERFQQPIVPQSTPTITVPGDNAPVAPEGSTDARFTLKSVVIEGATVFPPSSFEQLYQAQIGHDVAISDIYRIRDAITAKYRSAGYILSQAIVPPQTIATGEVRIRIVEGSIARVMVEGAAASDPLVSAMAARIKASSPLNARDLERYALLMNDLPGVSASTILKPSDTPGTADLVVTTQRKPVQGSSAPTTEGQRPSDPLKLPLG